MKKIVAIALLMASFLSSCVSAQDTIPWGSPRYMFNPRVQRTHRPAWYTDSNYYWEMMVLNGRNIPNDHGDSQNYYGHGWCLSYCATPKEPVTVYGVALVMDSMDCDTLDMIKFQVTLCQKVGGALTLLDTALAINGIDVNRFYTSIVGDGVLYEFIRPVYEFYFDQPHVMCDSFYVGFFRPYISNNISTEVRTYFAMDSINTSMECFDPRFITSIPCSTTGVTTTTGKWNCFPILQPCPPPEIRLDSLDMWNKVLSWDGDVQDSFQLSVTDYSQPADSGTIFGLTDTTYSVVDWPRDVLYAARVRVKCTSNEAKCPAVDRWSPWSEPVYFYFGPDMPDTTSVDTTGTGGDTTGIATADLQQISITPNPATGTVTVRSAEQMTEIEVVDIVGASVLRQQASGLAARLDVKALPRGSYTVRIHTPLGVTSRKLILQ